jgi:broad specificity phosphatase PhoE
MRSSAALVAIAVVVLVGLTVGAAPPVAARKGLIVLVRHAERVPAPATEDAPLTEAGRARAQKLAAMLAKADIRAVFTTRFRRTQETAKPLADVLRLTPIVESDPAELVAALRTRPDENVLVIGHSDTVPGVITAFGGPAVTIGDDEFDDLFVLAPASGALTRLKY